MVGVSARAIRIGVLDNDPFALDAMCAMISAVSKDFRVMWSTGSPAVAIEHCHNPHTRPEVLVLDMALGGITGADVCRRIRRRTGGTGIVCVTSYSVDVYQREAIASGAQGLFAKERLRTDIAVAIRWAAQGLPADEQAAVGFRDAQTAYGLLSGTVPAKMSVDMRDIIPREDWEVIEGCHEAIVTPEEWEQVQDIIDRRPTIMKGNACPFYNLFHGLVYCATCGKSMQVRYEKVGRTGKNRFTGEMREPIDRAYYICQTYNRLGKNACTSHKIEARDLYNLALKDIQELAAQAMKDADAFYQRLSSRMERRYLVDASQTEKERKRLEARNQEIDGMFLSLYTDKAKGVLTEQRFMKLTAALEQEQEANQKRLHDLAVMQSRADAQESEVRTFIKEIRRYATIEELDEAVLNRLISRILIGEVKKVDGQKVQEVRIVYNFVGEIPEIAA